MYGPEDIYIFYYRLTQIALLPRTAGFEKGIVFYKYVMGLFSQVSHRRSNSFLFYLGSYKMLGVKELVVAFAYYHL